jgi:nucleotide-binding universal stress UspA family protein
VSKIERILVATDFTEAADYAVDYAVELAKGLGASLTIVHAYEIPTISFPDGGLVVTQELASRIIEVATEALRVTVARVADHGVRVVSVLREGHPRDAVPALADEIDAQLIVLGTHGRRGIARVLLGSTAENVIRTSLRPALVVRGPMPSARNTRDRITA